MLLVREEELIAPLGPVIAWDVDRLILWEFLVLMMVKELIL